MPQHYSAVIGTTLRRRGLEARRQASEAAISTTEGAPPSSLFPLSGCLSAERYWGDTSRERDFGPPALMYSGADALGRGAVPACKFVVLCRCQPVVGPRIKPMPLSLRSCDCEVPPAGFESAVTVSSKHASDQHLHCSTTAFDPHTLRSARAICAPGILWDR